MVVSPNNMALVKKFLADDNVTCMMLWEEMSWQSLALFTSETLLEQDFCATETFEAMFPSKQLRIQN